MTDSQATRPKTLEAALRALDHAEAELRAHRGDDTGVRRLSNTLQSSEERFRMLAEGVPNHLLFLDRDLRILFANDVFLEASGWSTATAVGRHISEIMGVERYLERQPYYERAVAGETVSYESTGAAGNEAGYFRFSYRPSFDEEGKVRGIFSMATDISERRKVELELEAKQAELRPLEQGSRAVRLCRIARLEGAVTRDRPLVQWITEGLAGYDTNNVQENLALLTKRTQRLNRLLDDLLAYSRAGRKVGAHRMADTHSLVLDMAQLLNPPPTISISIDGQLPKFKTHPAPLEQVFRNLIGNAVKHHPGPQGRIVVSCKEQGEHYVFAVEDDGEGIPAEYAERVFEMFQTLKPRDQVEGSGMGLAIVNRIVQWQGGRVWFEPAAGGRGTVFRFQWKKHDPLAATGETQAWEAARS